MLFLLYLYWSKRLFGGGGGQVLHKPRQVDPKESRSKPTFVPPFQPGPNHTLAIFCIFGYNLKKTGMGVHVPALRGLSPRHLRKLVAPKLHGAPMTDAHDLKIITGQLIDGTGTPPIPSGAVVVEGDKIAWVGAESALPEKYLQSDALRLGGPGYTVMPGLIDGHLHISFGESRTEEELAIYTPVEYRALKAAYHAKKVLRAGVTSAFDAAGTYNVAVAIRNGIEAGIVEGPRLAVCGRQITTHQGLEDAFPAGTPWPPGQAGLLVRSRDEIVEAVRLQVKEGVDCIKVSGSSDVPHATDPIDGAAFTQEEFTLIANEAHRLNRKVAVHARTREAILLAARAGFDFIMHASYIDDEGIEACLKSKSTIIPTLTLLASIDDLLPREEGNASDGNVFRKEYQAAAGNLKRAHDAGIPFITGSESGWSLVPYGEWHARELKIFVEHLGLTPMQAITSATSIAARMLPRFADKIGSLAARKFADILLIDGNPLADIGVLLRPSARKAVLKGGALVDIETPIPARKVWSFEKNLSYLPGWYRFNEQTGAGYIDGFSF